MNRLYFGDNLEVLRRRDIKDESVDLIYLDPPFNSNATYNLLFKSKGRHSDAQIAAFEDTWHWGPLAEREFSELIQGTNTDVVEMMRALRDILGENDMMAYLTMMANRLVELQRVLKPTGSLYLHCDPHASHYLKMLLDSVFGASNFRNEIVWKRTSAHSAARRWNDVHDTLLFYTKSDEYTWNPVLLPHTDEYAGRYKNVDAEGRRWSDDNLTGPGTRNGDSGAEWRGFNPTLKGSHWKVSNKAVEAIIGAERASKLSTTQKLDVLDKHGLIHWPKARDAGSKGFPRFKRVLSAGAPIQDMIWDIPPVNSQAQERVGYPTQKPIALLERIIEASSNKGDVVLDPFCGCGTAVHAAQTLERRWIGIDVAPIAIDTIKDRLGRAFPGLEVMIDGRPTDLEGATKLAQRNSHQFELWACSRVGARHYRQGKKGADTGIDGVIYFEDDKGSSERIVVSVKGGQNVSVQMIRDLRGVVERDKSAIGMLVTLTPPTRPMRDEAVKAGYFTSSRGSSFPKLQILTIKGLLNGTERPMYPDAPMGGYVVKKRGDNGVTEQRDLFDSAPDKRSPQNVESMLGYLASTARAPASKAKSPGRSTPAKVVAKDKKAS